MIDGVRSGPGKLTYSTENLDLESYTGDWSMDKKVKGLLSYREFPRSNVFSLLLVVHCTMANSPKTINDTGKVFYTWHLGPGMRVVGSGTRCMICTGHTILKA